MFGVVATSIHTMRKVGDIGLNWIGLNPGRPWAECLSNYLLGGPNGVRTRVSGVRGQRPGPLDDGTIG